MRNLNSRDLEKFSRQIIIDKIGITGQKKIIDSSVCVIGCGGLGTSASQYLAMTGIGEIMLIDNDIIDLSNLNRQALFFEKDIGKSKVKVLSENLKKINNTIKIKYLKKKITKKNIVELLPNFKFILDCTDNFKSKYIINEYCFKKKKTLVSCAIQNFDVQASVFSSWKKDFPCYECVFPNTKNFENKNCNSMGITAPVAGIGGLFQAMLTLNVIIDNSNGLFKELILFDSFNRTFKKIKIKKNPKCKICGK